ncbi:uncharacterized protein ACA1_064880 [Acanthamoeba castellanii str. Neff]|uniref:Uncharacterized protein n=1 Tax=Acanthamoeba castellanii (strain ATCC 30010 / Neff) TaxID=1257118 RepID=L8H010_ACACF|nr:uncharacterized protein ACA1_064880 [Acanthamoeba castellanii str. Neff]ELR17701.1 hypothetical protein ACA1_064880 [Acanthamoeba castellanii str. Neff]
MASSCKSLKEELVACLKISPCMQDKEKTFHECLKSKDEDEIGTGYFECKRGQLDMRKRFKGNVDFIRKSPTQAPAQPPAAGGRS